MKTLEILSFDDFSDIFEINLNKQPNQIFTSTINRQIYKFIINTFIDGKTFIKIEKNGEIIGQGFIKIGIDLTFLNTNEAGQFFFLKKTNSDLINFNWENFGGEIPLEEEKLKTLAGVGQKTAHVVLLEAIGANVMAVDTHVFRVAHRLGLSRAKTPELTEADLVKAFKTDLGKLHQAIVLFGRYTCKAIKPLCKECFLSEVCKSKDKRI